MVAVASLCFLKCEEVSNFFLPSSIHNEEGMPMYITWESLILFCSFLIAVIGLVIDINNKKK